MCDTLIIQKANDYDCCGSFWEHWIFWDTQHNTFSTFCSLEVGSIYFKAAIDTFYQSVFSCCVCWHLPSLNGRKFWKERSNCCWVLRLWVRWCQDRRRLCFLHLLHCSDACHFSCIPASQAEGGSTGDESCTCMTLGRSVGGPSGPLSGWVR